MQTISLLLKHSDVQKINTVLMAFLWWHRNPCIASQKPCLPKSKGGVGLLNIRFYNLSCLLWKGLDWLWGQSHYTSFMKESDLVAPYKLLAVLHSKLAYLPNNIRLNILIGDIVLAWREVRKLLGLPSAMPHFLSIIGNPPSIEHKAFCDLTKVTSVFGSSPGISKSFADFSDEFSLPGYQVFHYH